MGDIALGLAVYAVWLWRARAAAPACAERRFYTTSRCFFTSACASGTCCLRWCWLRCSALCTPPRLCPAGGRTCGPTLINQFSGAALYARRAAGLPAGAGAQPARWARRQTLRCGVRRLFWLLGPPCGPPRQAAREQGRGRLKKRGKRAWKFHAFLIYYNCGNLSCKVRRAALQGLPEEGTYERNGACR